MNVKSVDKAYNGKSALLKVEKNNNMQCVNHKYYKLVMLDQNMPILNGNETSAIIRH